MSAVKYEHKRKLAPKIIFFFPKLRLGSIKQNDQLITSQVSKLQLDDDNLSSASTTNLIHKN